MSHNPRPNYAYPQLPQEYYVDDQEGFVSDYSDSDAISENQQAFRSVAPQRNVTELYARNCTVPPQQVIPVKQQYQHTSQPYIQQYYHNRNLAQIPRTQSAIPPQNYGHSHSNPQPRQYYPIEETNYDYANPKNMPQMQQYQSQMRSVQDTSSYNLMPKQPILKRYPVTVGTPKYYRKPPVNSIYKRPSALCLPVASQPDPAAYRRPKRPPVFTNQALYGMQQEIPAMENRTMETPAVEAPKIQGEPISAPHKVDSEGDVNAKISNFEELLAKFERDNIPKKGKSRHDLAKISKFLKPRVPSSIRAKQEKSKSKAAKTKGGAAGENSPEASPDKDQTEVQDVTADSLERLLNQLKKCELAVGNEPNVEKNEPSPGSRHRKDKPDKKEDERSAEKSNASEDERSPRPPPKSFNYRDISEHMMRTQCELDEEDSTSSIQDITKRITNSITDSTPNRPRPFTQICRKPTMDDHCALELHRSKSYIVNLIDRALSKELGTVPGERSRRKFDDMNPKKAIDAVNRHSGSSDKELSVKITSALTDSLISNATAPEEDHHLEPTSSNKVCCCNTEEPTYIKQLKQLRWGHLKHIQREVRRLEDLERFLDSCSITTIPEL